MVVTKLSISEVNQFLSCPFAWFTLYVQRVSVKKSESLFFGSAIHEGLAAYYKQQDPLVAVKTFLASEEANRMRPEEANNEDIIEIAEKIFDTYKKSGPYLVADEQWIEQKKVVELFHPKTRSPLGVPFVFKIDLITKDGFIVDHKTAKSASADQSEANKLQGIAYYLAYYSLFQKRPAGFIQNVIVKQKSGIKIVPRVYSYSQDDEVFAYETIAHVVSLIETEQWRQTPPLAKTYYPCPVANICPYHGKILFSTKRQWETTKSRQ